MNKNGLKRMKMECTIFNINITICHKSRQILGFYLRLLVIICVFH